MKIKIVIIGAKGMLGQELARVFKKDNEYEVSAWDRNEIDITDKKQIKERISKLKPAIIINAAAYNAVDKCEESVKEYALAKKLNSLAPGYLADIAKNIKAVLVHYSSDYVFDGLPEMLRVSKQAGEPDFPEEPLGCTGSCGHCSLHKEFKPEIGFREDDKAKPISKYGRSKLMGERAVQKNGKKYYIIRLSKLFGKPATSDGAKRSFFDVMLEVGKNPPAGGMEVKVVDEEISCFTYAPDLAKKTKEIIEARKPYGIYHVTNSEVCTWYEAACELYQQAGLRTKVVPVSSAEFPRPAKRPAISTLINTKLNPLRSYKKALRDYLKA